MRRACPIRRSLAAMSEEDRKRSFFGQSVGRRAAVVVAGPLTNFILAIVIFAGVFMMFGKPTAVPRVASVEPNSAAAAAGFQPGDLVTAIDGRKIDNFVDMQRIVGFSGGHPLTIVVDRGGVPVTLTATPEIKNGSGVLGCHPVKPTRRCQRRIGRSARCSETRGREDLVHRRNHADLHPGRVRRPPVGRPDRRSDRNRPDLRSGRRARMGCAVRLRRGDFRVSIGLLNLFPVPLLDGGHLLFYSIEAVRGRPLSERAQEVGFRIGLAIVVMLMIFATVNDILHLRAS